MKAKRILILIIVLFISSCAQVPKESVKLSATVGRDLSEMRKAHQELVVLYYDRILKDINNFVDDIYAPYQIQKTLNQHKNTIISAIKSASKPDSTGEKQKECLAILGVYLEEIRNEIETYRDSKIGPVIVQKDALLKSIDESYERIHYANSIVTGHLASVVKVHDTQNEILSKVDLEDLRSKIGIKTADLSEKISELIKKAEKNRDKLDKFLEEFDALVKENIK